MDTEASEAVDWQEFLDRAMQGDGEALGELWQKYLYPRIYRYAKKVLNNSSDAEDVAQEVFKSFFEHLRCIKRKDLSGFVGYVRQIAHNLCLDYLRGRKQIRFVVTSQTLEQLRLAGVDGDVIRRLQILQCHSSVGRAKFLKLLKEKIGSTLNDTQKALILKYSRYDRTRWRPLPDEVIPQDGGESPVQDEVERAEIARIFYDEIWSTLSQEERDAFYQQYCAKDFSYRKYSEQTGISTSTLFSRCKKVREMILKNKKLRTYWKDL